MATIPSTGKIPAAMGGIPAFEQPVEVVKTALPDFDVVTERLGRMWVTCRLSNNGYYVRELERLISETVGVKHCIAVSNGTISLIMILKSLGLTGRIVLPSFTFCATVHAAVWAGLEPVFADIDPETFNISPETVEAVMSDDVSAVMPVCVYGSPCDMDGLESLALRYDVRLVFDSAQAIGSKYHGRQLGSFGDAESFSVHATKMLPAGEGGLITTSNDDLADYLRCARNFGLTEDADCDIIGTNAKMQEFSALLGIEGLYTLGQAIEYRGQLVRLYREMLGKIPGIRFQIHSPDCESNHQNMAVVIDEREFGISRNELMDALSMENINCRKYFYPPIHRTSVYAGRSAHAELPVTDMIAARVLCLPIHSDMPHAVVERICSTIHQIHNNSQAVGQALGQEHRKAA